MRNPFLLLALAMTLATSPSAAQQADLIIHHAKIYTVDSAMSTAEAFAVKDGRFLAVGTNEEVLEQYKAPKVIDLQGKPVYPGFIDAHAHFYWYGLMLQQVNLVGTKSWEEVLERVQAFAAEEPEGWLQGRGWDQNDWPVKEFPSREELDRLFPGRPVYLKRIDGHAAIANTKALELARITAESAVEGGEVEVENGQPTGILIDNAMELVNTVIPAPSQAEREEALLEAQESCFQVGLTSIHDAGLERDIISTIDSLQKLGKLKMRLYAMLLPTEDNLEHFLEHGPYKTSRLHIRAFKFFADGALGSRGAALLDPYHDAHEKIGLLLHDTSYFRHFTQLMYEHGFQMATHAIGDRGNRLMLDLYAQVLPEDNDRRWRIEHAQIVAPEDYSKFRRYNIIPSVQPTHATSDMYWADERLGPRIKHSYAYKQLLQEAGLVAGGSDFPIEHINPLYGFFAAVARQDHKNRPEGGFQPENALTREEALKAMTIWAAYAAFEEQEKGSIEPGKLADFVVLEEDIMTIPLERTWQAKVLQTWIDGERVGEE